MANEELFVPLDAEEEAKTISEAQKRTSGKTPKQAAREAQQGGGTPTFYDEYIAPTEPYGRAILPVIGAGFGGTIGLGMTGGNPYGGFAGGSLGAGAGEALADLIYGGAPTQASDIVPKTAEYLAEGAASEILGTGVAKGIETIGKGGIALGKGTAKLAKRAWRGLTGEEAAAKYVDDLIKSIESKPELTNADRTTLYLLKRQGIKAAKALGYEIPEGLDDLARAGKDVDYDTAAVLNKLDEVYSGVDDSLGRIEKLSEDKFYQTASPQGYNINKQYASAQVNKKAPGMIRFAIDDTYSKLNNIASDLPTRPYEIPGYRRINMETGKTIEFAKKDLTPRSEDVSTYIGGSSNPLVTPKEVIDNSLYLSDSTKNFVKEGLDVLESSADDLINSISSLQKGEKMGMWNADTYFDEAIKNLDSVRSKALQKIYQIAKGNIKEAGERDLEALATLVSGIDQAVDASIPMGYTNPKGLTQLVNVLGKLRKYEGNTKAAIDALVLNPKSLEAITELPAVEQGANDLAVNLMRKSVINKIFKGEVVRSPDEFLKLVDDYVKRMNTEAQRMGLKAHPYAEYYREVADTFVPILRLKEQVTKSIGGPNLRMRGATGTKMPDDLFFGFIESTVKAATSTKPEQKAIWAIAAENFADLISNTFKVEARPIKLALYGALGSGVKNKIQDLTGNIQLYKENQLPQPSVREYSQPMQETTQPPVRLQDLGTVRSK